MRDDVMASRPNIKVTVINSGRERKIDRQSTIAMRLFREAPNWVLIIDSDTCAEKRKRTKKTEHEEYLIKEIAEIIATPEEILITCRTITQRKAC